MKLQKFIIGSAIALSSFALIGCGDDSSSGAAPETPTSSSSLTPYSAPEVTNDEIITIGTMGQDIDGETVLFSGTIELNRTDTTVSLDSLVFTKLEFSVARKNGTELQNSSAKVSAVLPTFPTTNRLNLRQMNVSINLADPEFTDCGSYDLYIHVEATDGNVTSKQNATIAFDRPEIYCKVEESSSSEAVAEVVMESCDVTLKTNDANGLDLSTCTATTNTATAAIVVKATGTGEVNITSEVGTLFSPITNDDDKNWDDDWSKGYYPENNLDRDVYMSDFRYKVLAATSIDNIISEDAGLVYVGQNASTGDNIFAFVLVGSLETTNKDFTLNFHVWKVK